MSPELQNTLAALANKLGVSAEYLWPKLVEHAQVKAIVEIVMAYSILIFVAWGLKRIFSAIRHQGVDADDPMVVLGVMLSVFVIFGTAVALSNAIPNAIYPEAAALHSLLIK